ncbi:MAG: SufS family cysteine desulfurase [Alphaproteobacteria bacterium]|nr:SufS family cysteine desulfurase [Alphaproteobacteria bacterium]
MPLDWSAIRTDFPALALKVNDHPLVYLDSGASAQKPQCVIDSMVECMQSGYANVHRGLHYLSEKATSNYESARDAVQRILGAADPAEIVFGMNATSLINLVAHSYAAEYFGAGDTVLISAMEHHANIVPWQIAARRAGFDLGVIPLCVDGSLDQEVYRRLLRDHRVRLVAVTHTSNVLGTVNPIAEMTQAAHDVGAKILIDGCQGIVHQSVDVQSLDVDFYCGAGHKLYGPSGIGFLFGKAEILAEMPPMLGGGDMIDTVDYYQSTWALPPARFEPGTPPIIEAIGLKAAIEYIETIGLSEIFAREAELTVTLLEKLREIPSLHVHGDAEHRAGLVSFSLGSAHPYDVAQLLDQLGGVAVRAGHHCAMPLHNLLNIPHHATVRASLGLYNTREDIDRLCTTLRKAQRMLED